jgi:hypothetical protein
MANKRRLVLAELLIRVTALEDVLLGVEADSELRKKVLAREDVLRFSDAMLEKTSQVMGIPRDDLEKHFLELALSQTSETPE